MSCSTMQNQHQNLPLEGESLVQSVRLQTDHVLCSLAVSASFPEHRILKYFN